MTKENNNNIYETVCDGKDLNFAISELRTKTVPQAVAERRYRIVVELLPEVTVEDCLRKAVESGKLLANGDGTYHWAEGVTIGMKALWVDRVAELTGLKSRWLWAEQVLGAKNIKQKLKQAQNNNRILAIVESMLPL